ncbi:MAG: single-stranded DNA-binding protein [Spirochaetota bacterium]|jgi:single-strand DNA-binding protein|nr:single-stranded DNA-binding protein [Spirochaetota bacterium]
MAFTINHIVLVGGNLTRDADLRYASNGNARLTFSVAMNRSYKDPGGQLKEITEYFNIVYWGKLAEAVAPRLKKGQKVAIEGRLSQRRYTTQEGQQRDVVEISASSVILIGNRAESARDAGYDSRPPASPAGGQNRSSWQGDQGGYTDDDAQYLDESPMEENDVPF